MRRVQLAVLAALGLAACGQPQGAQEAAHGADQKAAGPVAVAVVPAPAAVTPAADFAAKAAAGDAFELRAAQVAEQKAASGGVRAFAGMMLRDHGKSSAEFRKAVAASGQALSPAGALSAAQAKGLADLAPLSGPDFDKAYMAGQVQAHQDALALMQDYAQNGDNPALKAFAAESSAVVQHHYALAKSLRDGLK